MGEVASRVRRCPTCDRVYADPAFGFCGKDGTALVDAAPPEPRGDPLVGKVLADRWQVLELIGSGAVGRVYVARDLASARELAIKILDPSLSDDPILVERFRREARAIRRINSPLVVTVHEVGVSYEGLLYIVMDYVRGKTLRQVLHDSGILPPVEAVRICSEIAAAVAAAHEAGVVHRDLKPENVVVEHTSRGVRVLDFGVAKLVDPEGVATTSRAKLTVYGAVMGTPTYMSPEAVERKPVGPACDLYALGVILFEMLTGKPPFDADQPLELMGMHLRVPAPRLLESRPNLDAPKALDELVDQLLAKKPEERVASAKALIRQLEYLQDIMASTDVLREDDLRKMQGLLPTPLPSTKKQKGEARPQRRAGTGFLLYAVLLLAMAGLAVTGYFAYLHLFLG